MLTKDQIKQFLTENPDWDLPENATPEEMEYYAEAMDELDVDVDGEDWEEDDDEDWDDDDWEDEDL
jgi:hypothetical protein